MPFDLRFFSNLQDDERNRLLDYRLMVYLCEGTDSEKLDWFRTINIAGEELTAQELRNAVYAGPWTADAKRYFSKPNGPAYGLASRYMKGDPIRQEYLRTVLNNTDLRCMSKAAFAEEVAKADVLINCIYAYPGMEVPIVTRDMVRSMRAVKQVIRRHYGIRL